MSDPLDKLNPQELAFLNMLQQAQAQAEHAQRPNPVKQKHVEQSSDEQPTRKVSGLMSSIFSVAGVPLTADTFEDKPKSKQKFDAPSAKGKEIPVKKPKVETVDEEDCLDGKKPETPSPSGKTQTPETTPPEQTVLEQVLKAALPLVGGLVGDHLAKPHGKIARIVGGILGGMAGQHLPDLLQILQERFGFGAQAAQAAQAEPTDEQVSEIMKDNPSIKEVFDKLKVVHPTATNQALLQKIMQQQTSFES